MRNSYSKFISIFLLSIFLLSIFLIQCSNKTSVENKTSSNDPFKESIVQSEYFKINTEKDTVLRGTQGTLLVFQKGSIIDNNGTVVEGKVTLELAEAFKITDMLRSNLTTTSDGELLETDGMIYYNVFRKNEQLYINPNKPVHIEIPTKNRKANMQVYDGIRDENGNMNWVNPIPIENYLNPVDIFALDLLPDGFEETVEKLLPFRNYTTAPKSLVDSLYYSLSFVGESEMKPESVPNINVKEHYTNNDTIESELDSLLVNSTIYGVDPAIIKTIRNSKFQNTLIATKEFSERLQVLFKICRTDVIDIYVRNLDKKLWELDSIAAMLLDDNVYQDDFVNFAAQKWTIVKDSDVNTKLLNQFYKQQLNKVKTELSEARNKAVKATNDKTAAAKKVIEQYQALLDKREAYRMTSYGFERTTTGWVNIDRGVVEKSWKPQSLEIKVIDGKTYNRIYAYIFFREMKSLYRLNTDDDGKTFFVGNAQQRELITPKNSNATAIVIAYKDSVKHVATKEYTTTITTTLNFKELAEIDEEALKMKLAQFEDNGVENSVLTGLKHLDHVYVEELRQEKLEYENLVMGVLSRAAFPRDSFYLKFDRKFGIAMPVDTCLNKTKYAKLKISPYYDTMD